MPIVIEYQPEAGLAGDIAFQAGLGRFKQAEDQFGLQADQFEESQRQFDEQNGYRNAALEEQRRQFDANNAYRYNAMAFQASEARDVRSAQRQAARDNLAYQSYQSELGRRAGLAEEAMKQAGFREKRAHELDIARMEQSRKDLRFKKEFEDRVNARQEAAQMGRAEAIHDAWINNKVTDAEYATAVEEWSNANETRWPFMRPGAGDEQQEAANDSAKALTDAFPNLSSQLAGVMASTINEIEDPLARAKAWADLQKQLQDNELGNRKLDVEQDIRQKEIDADRQEKARQSAEQSAQQQAKALEQQDEDAGAFMADLHEYEWKQDQWLDWTHMTEGEREFYEGKPPTQPMPPSIYDDKYASVDKSMVYAVGEKIDGKPMTEAQKKQSIGKAFVAMDEGEIFWWYPLDANGKTDYTRPLRPFIKTGERSFQPFKAK